MLVKMRWCFLFITLVHLVVCVHAIDGRNRTQMLVEAGVHPHDIQDIVNGHAVVWPSRAHGEVIAASGVLKADVEGVETCDDDDVCGPELWWKERAHIGTHRGTSANFHSIRLASGNVTYLMAVGNFGEVFEQHCIAHAVQVYKWNRDTRSFFRPGTAGGIHAKEHTADGSTPVGGNVGSWSGVHREEDNAMGDEDGASFESVERDVHTSSFTSRSSGRDFDRPEPWRNQECKEITNESASKMSNPYTSDFDKNGFVEEYAQAVWSIPGCGVMHVTFLDLDLERIDSEVADEVALGGYFPHFYFLAVAEHGHDATCGSEKESHVRLWYFEPTRQQFQCFQDIKVPFATHVATGHVGLTFLMCIASNNTCNDEGGQSAIWRYSVNQGKFVPLNASVVAERTSSCQFISPDSRSLFVAFAGAETGDVHTFEYNHDSGYFDKGTVLKYPREAVGLHESARPSARSMAVKDVPFNIESASLPRLLLAVGCSPRNMLPDCEKLRPPGNYTAPQNDTVIEKDIEWETYHDCLEFTERKLVPSIVYQWRNGTFSLVQSFKTRFVVDVELIEVYSHTYMLLLENELGVATIMYVWDGHSFRAKSELPQSELSRPVDLAGLYVKQLSSSTGQHADQELIDKLESDYWGTFVVNGHGTPASVYPTLFHDDDHMPFWNFTLPSFPMWNETLEVFNGVGNSSQLTLQGNCSPQNCNNHGMCDPNSIRCVCNGNYYGNGCQFSANGRCAVSCPNNCTNENGVCDVLRGSCTCHEGYEGTDCSQQADLITAKSMGEIRDALRSGYPLINLKIPFNSSQSTSIDYWFLTQHAILLFSSWEEIEVFSLGLMLPSVEFVDVELGRPFESQELPEQIERAARTLYEVIADENLSASYGVYHLSTDYEDDQEIVSCEQEKTVYCIRSVAEVPSLYAFVEETVQLLSYCSITVLFLILLASARPVFEVVTKLQTDTGIPFRLWGTKDIYLRVHWPIAITAVSIIAWGQMLYLGFVTFARTPPGVYEYYRQIRDIAYYTQTATIVVVVVSGLALLLMVCAWSVVAFVGAKYTYERVKSKKKLICMFDHASGAQMAPFEDDNDFTIPVLASRRSLLHPVLHLTARRLLAAAGFRGRILRALTGLSILIIYIATYLVPAFGVFAILVGVDTLTYGIFGLVIAIFSVYYCSFWFTHSSAMGKELRHWSGVIRRDVGSQTRKYFVLENCISAVVWICVFICGAVAANVIVLNLSAVVLAISINSFSYTIATFSITFLILLSDEYYIALYPFVVAKKIILEKHRIFTDMSVRSYIRALDFLRLSHLRRLMEGAVRAVLLFGLLMLGMVAVVSAADQASQSLLLLITTLVPVMTAVISYVRRVTDFEEVAFKKEVLSVLDLLAQREKALSEKSVAIEWDAEVDLDDEDDDDDDDSGVDGQTSGALVPLVS